MKPTRLDELHRADHCRILDTDSVYFLGEYIPGGGWAASEMNSLVFNLKRAMSYRGTTAWPHKERAIRSVARSFSTWESKTIWGVTSIIPAPPAECPIDPNYDDRMVRVAALIGQDTGAAVLDVVSRTETVPKSHTQTTKREPAKIAATMQVDVRALRAGLRGLVVVLDDVLTTGAHFRAMRSVLDPLLGVTPVVGLFVARRIFPDGGGASTGVE